ncbi:MAG: hypothetical protein HOP33_21935 [Verrucomicrobia bacterium]|nr:hypothetical protein [Verrucomicrobiota bacterium]
MKTVSKLKIHHVTPPDISVLLCHVPAVTAVFFNVCRAWAAKLAVQQKWA